MKNKESEMFRNLLLIIPLLIIACSNDDGSSGPVCTKDVRSTWAANEVNLTLDLSQFELNTPDSIVFNFSTGEQCTANGQITGDGCAGTFVITSSVYTGGGSGDPGCSTMIGTDNYSIIGSDMTVCEANNPASCYTYN